MDNIKHTELPYEIFGTHGGDTIIISSKNKDGLISYIAHLDYWRESNNDKNFGKNKAITEANAEFVINACNSFYRREALLKKIREVICDNPAITDTVWVGNCETLVDAITSELGDDWQQFDKKSAYEEGDTIFYPIKGESVSKPGTTYVCDYTSEQKTKEEK